MFIPAITSLFSSVKFYVFGFIALAIVTACFFAYKAHTDVVAENANLRSDLAKVTLAKQVQDETIQAQEEALVEWEENEVKWTETLEEQRKIEDDARAELDRLNELFAKHDLQTLVDKKPNSISRLINRGTLRAQRMLECASGSQNDYCDNEDLEATSEEETP